MLLFCLSLSKGYFYFKYIHTCIYRQTDFCFQHQFNIYLSCVTIPRCTAINDPQNEHGGRNKVVTRTFKIRVWTGDGLKLPVVTITGKIGGCVLNVKLLQNIFLFAASPAASVSTPSSYITLYSSLLSWSFFFFHFSAHCWSFEMYFISFLSWKVK